MNERRRALITGASGAIGKSIARLLAAEDYDLVLHYFEGNEAIMALAEELQYSGVDVDIVQADLSKSGEVNRLLNDMAAKRYHIDLLVNNAGISEWGLFSQMEEERYGEVMNTNFSSVYYLCRELLPQMVQRKQGVVVNVASIWGLRGASCEAIYAASKAAIISLTKSLAREYGPSGIRINAVAPGVIKSEMLASFSEEDLRNLAKETPLFRLGHPHEVADAVVFLASDKASFITGQTLVVDGGFIA